MQLVQLAMYSNQALAHHVEGDPSSSIISQKSTFSKRKQHSLGFWRVYIFGTMAARLYAEHIPMIDYMAH